MFDLSIVIPCYNEEKNLQSLVGKIQEIKQNNQNINLEFILVNDGSTDQTSAKLFELNNDNIYSIVDLKKNHGYGGSIQEGLKKSKGDIVSWTHSDLQCDIVASLLVPSHLLNPLIRWLLCLCFVV